jgi:hypothetical protein
MSHHAKRQTHEQARKKHKQEMQQHARELAKRGRSRFPIWLLILSIGLMLALVFGAFLLF